MCLNHFTVFYINRVQRLARAQLEQRPLQLRVLQIPRAPLKQRPLQLRVLQRPRAQLEQRPLQLRVLQLPLKRLPLLLKLQQRQLGKQR